MPVPQHPAWSWLGYRGLRYLRRNRDVQVPSSSPTPTKAGMKQEPAATWRRETEQRVPTAREINSRNKGGGRKTGPVLPCQAPSSSQAQAAKPQLRSRACPNILLRSWMQPTTKAQSPIWPPPAPASSTAYTYIGFCRLILLSPSSLHCSPKSYIEVALQEHDQWVGEGAFCSSCRTQGNRNSEARKDHGLAETQEHPLLKSRIHA